MKYLKSCLSKRSLLDTTVLLISISFIEIVLLFWWNFYSSVPLSNSIIYIHFYVWFLTKLLTKEQQESYEDAKICYICKEEFQSKYVKDK